jgi:hypothetical protein
MYCSNLFFFRAGLLYGTTGRFLIDTARRMRDFHFRNEDLKK